MEGFTLVFDGLQQPFAGWVWGAFSVVGLGMLIVPSRLNEDRSAKLSLGGTGVLLIFLGLIAIWLNWTEYARLRSALQNGNVRTAQGIATYLPSRDRVSDSIRVAGVEFNYGGGTTGGAAYERTRVGGGENLEGRCVLIKYVEDRFEKREIVWLAVRGRTCSASEPTPLPALQAAPPPRT